MAGRPAPPPRCSARYRFTGLLSARLGGAPPGRAALRNVLGGGLATAVTYAPGVDLDAAGV